MKRSLSLALLVCVAALAFPYLEGSAQSGAAASNPGISMTIYPVVRKADGKQYLITPSGKEVTIPGLGIAPNATQVAVYHDMNRNFWYNDTSGRPVAVTPAQLEAAQAQMNAPSGVAGGMPPQMMPPAQSYYSSTPSYAGGYNGIPYGTPVNMEGPGQYSYMAPGGNKQFVSPSPQTSAEFTQWHQQVPYGQQPTAGAMQGGASQTQHSSSSSQDVESRGDRRRQHRADRLENRAQNQRSNASSDQTYADQKMQSGETLGTGMTSRRSARESRRAKREDRRADFLDGN
ncbi:MAG: hypothetical protein K2W95_09095 [Candidatus Obscuribacterales bacterium]|nr:hypothetical protein [Candidatus Obscuribacterales bacterium]